MTTLSCIIKLPTHYRAGDILAFHQRDPLRVAERVDGNTLRKGLVWKGRAACLTVRFQARQAVAELAIDGSRKSNGTDALKHLVRRMVGLTQPIETFEQIYRDHPQLGPLIAKHPGLRFPLTATPFEALTWAVAAQQISVHAAVSLRRKLIQAAGVTHSSGLMCYPDAPHIARLSEADLRQAGFSRTKAGALLSLTQQVMKNQMPLDAWVDAPPVEEIRERLLRVRGIGPWTVNYALLRGFGWLDGSLHGDIAVRRALQSLLGRHEKITEEQAKRWLAEFSPWRALVAAHLWAMNSP